MEIDDGTARWIEAGLDELAEGGVDGVRVEVVAERLGVTKGGFYRRFKDRRALLDGILQTWCAGRIQAIGQQAELSGASPGERLLSLVKLYSERVNAQGMAIELAIRQWARGDVAAAAAVARVDAERLGKVGALFSAMGLTGAEAEARAVLFYCFIFGQSLLFLDHPPRKRASLIAACASKLLQIDSTPA
jgi:AcrR family transcriptional regulator